MSKKLSPFRLRFAVKDVPRWRDCHRAAEGVERTLWKDVAPEVRKRGFYNKREFLKVCDWKSPRNRSRFASNSARLVEMVSRAALSSADEQARIETLTLLDGVGWPTASALLHFGSKDEYPILRSDKGQRHEPD